MRRRNRITAVLAALMACVMILSSCAGGRSGDDLDSVIKDAAEYLVENVEVDSADSLGGGWIPFALKMSGTDAADDDYYEAYYDSIRALAKATEGVISEDRVTANERVSINLKAIGKDPTDVEGFDLMKQVDDYDAVKAQGLNAEIYALIAGKYCGYELKNGEQYLYDLIASQMPDGAFGMDTAHPDADMTGMAVQALALYRDEDERAEGAITRALEWLGEKQDDTGGYGSCESDAQVVIAIGCIGYDIKSGGDDLPLDTEALYEDLLAYRTDKGFSHVLGDEVDVLATEQALMALDAVKMAAGGERMFS